MSPPPDRSAEEAFRNVLAHRTMLKSYVQAIVRDPFLAEDAFSEVTLEIVRSWERFDSSRPFEAWARGIARRVALVQLRKKARQPIALDQDVLESLGQELDRCGNEAELELRKEALAHCISSLSESSRQMLRLRYFENRPYEDIARVAGRSVGALYVLFSRIHGALRDCVGRRLQTP